MAIDTAQGQLRWTWKLKGVGDGLVAQADGTTWFVDEPMNPPGEPQLVSISRNGALRLIPPSRGGRPLATYDDRLMLWSGELVSTVDGSIVDEIGTAGGGYSYTIDPMTPLFGDGVLYLVGNNWGLDVATPVYPGASIRRFDPLTGNMDWTVRLDVLGTPSPPYGTETSQPLLLADQSVLVARGDSAARWPWQLLEISPEGAAAWACDLPAGSQYGYATVIANERLFTVSLFNGFVASQSIEAFDVPGLELASQGWVVLGGTPEGGGRPR
ncbi:MAG: hypothetical protein IRZ16_06265 [Myxococcaceae bacterium]|nr:hypothetical protein [Myxococcaceae bacterium]